jgi:hypothetical protein
MRIHRFSSRITRCYFWVSAKLRSYHHWLPTIECLSWHAAQLSQPVAKATLPRRHHLEIVSQISIRTCILQFLRFWTFLRFYLLTSELYRNRISDSACLSDLEHSGYSFKAFHLLSNALSYSFFWVGPEEIFAFYDCQRFHFVFSESLFRRKFSDQHLGSALETLNTCSRALFYLSKSSSRTFFEEGSDEIYVPYDFQRFHIVFWEN